nr:YggT family protein [Variovorax dokdonensis]
MLLASSVKLIAEIALLALIGQWLLGLLAGRKREENFFYRLLQVLTQPFTRVVRAITPRIVLDRHVPLATLLLLAVVWLVATLAKVNICMQIGVQACR